MAFLHLASAYGFGAYSAYNAYPYAYGHAAALTYPIASAYRLW